MFERKGNPEMALNDGQTMSEEKYSNLAPFLIVPYLVISEITLLQKINH